MHRGVAVMAGLVGLWFLLLASPRSLGESLVKFAYAAILLVFAYQRFRTSPKGAAGYARHEEDGRLRLDVTPAAAPVHWFAAVLAIALGAGVTGSGISLLWIMGLLFAAITWMVLLKDPRGLHATRQRTFHVGPEGVEVGGQLLRTADIHHVGIRNRFGGGVEIVYDASQGIPTGVAAGIAHRRKLAEVAYRVEIEAGGEAHVLAAGLDQVTARGLATEVGRALNPDPAKP
ncbi:MAG: hypothetical protein OZ923_12705 [Comamonadaceae bacterium]|nr:hypothetical protein [Comamonadaceae bacterium]